MFWGFENFLHRSLFHEAPLEHDQDPVGKVGDDAEVMSDQEDRHPELLAEITEEVEYLGLNRDIQRGGGFVGDKEFGLTG